MLEGLKDGFRAVRSLRLHATYREFGRVFVLDHLDPRRSTARQREYSFISMLATNSVYVHIPKTAGVSVQKTLYGNYGMGHMGIRKYRQFLRPGFLNRAFVFTVVRNPWSRLHSAYHFLMEGGWPGTRDEGFQKMLACECPSFEHFVLDCLPRPEIREIDHFRPSLDQLLDTDGAFFPFDFIGRYARLEKDFAKLADAFGVPPRLPHLNTTGESTIMGYAKAYTPRMIDTVGELYRDTVAALGYTFDGYSDTIPALEKIRTLHPGKRPGKRAPLPRDHAHLL